MVYERSEADQSEKIERKKQYIPPVRATDEEMILLPSIQLVKAEARKLPQLNDGGEEASY